VSSQSTLDYWSFPISDRLWTSGLDLIFPLEEEEGTSSDLRSTTPLLSFASKQDLAVL
ncbi:Hypothetical protein FKW44_005920, partial [Caligus rogercresseyi]